MLEIFAIAAGIALVFGLLSFAAAAGYTAICLVAGAGIGGFLVLVICIKISDKRQERENLRREREHQRLLELIHMARATGANVSVPTLEITQKRLVKR
jgi:hypothetical protein